MTKIITAIAEENILKKIKKNKLVDNKNILYREAIIDTIKKDKKINIIIISENIPGEINLIKLLKNIKRINKKIKIIIILENKKIKEKLNKINITDIYYNNIFSTYKLVKNLKEKRNNIINLKKNIYKIKDKIFKLKKQKRIKDENNIICIFGDDKINKKIIKLIIEKNLIIKNIKIININLNIKNKKKINKRILKINKTKNIYYLIMKENYTIKEKTIDKNIKEIININSILKNRNSLIKIKIIKKIIKQYIKNNYYIIFNINFSTKKININPLKLKNKNYLILENNKSNLLNIYKNKIENKNIYLILINYYKNNISKYFYKIILKNKFKKIKIINLA